MRGPRLGDGVRGNAREHPGGLVADAEEPEDLLAVIEEQVFQRRFGEVVRIELETGMVTDIVALDRLMKGRTTLVIAHRLSTVRALDRLLVFDKGRIVEEGDHDALIRLNGGIYRRLFEKQALELTKGLVA